MRHGNEVWVHEDDCTRIGVIMILNYGVLDVLVVDGLSYWEVYALFLWFVHLILKYIRSFERRSLPTGLTEIAS